MKLSFCFFIGILSLEQLLCDDSENNSLEISQQANPCQQLLNLCLKCSKEELSEVYCHETGYKTLISCSETKKEDESEEVVQNWESCSPSQPLFKVSSYAVSPVITFQILMAVFGGLAYWGVQTHRESSMTQFDSRRSRQRYSRLQTV